MWSGPGKSTCFEIPGWSGTQFPGYMKHNRTWAQGNRTINRLLWVYGSHCCSSYGGDPWNGCCLPFLIGTNEPENLSKSKDRATCPCDTLCMTFCVCGCVCECVSVFWKWMGFYVVVQFSSPEGWTESQKHFPLFPSACTRPSSLHPQFSRSLSFSQRQEAALRQELFLRQLQLPTLSATHKLTHTYALTLKFYRWINHVTAVEIIRETAVAQKKPL